MISDGISFIVPCYNEKKRVEETVKSLKNITKYLKIVKTEIIIIDDGSEILTKQILKKIKLKFSKLRIITHKKNKGIGAAIISGLYAARLRRCMIVPGDNDLPKSTIENLLRLRNKASLLLSYFIDREKRGYLRCFLSSTFCLLYELSFNLHVQYINCPALYYTKEVKALNLKSKRFSIIAEINTKLLKKGVTFLEIPSQRQTGTDESSALKISSIIDAFLMYFYIMFIIYIKEKEKYCYQPIRINVCPYLKIRSDRM